MVSIVLSVKFRFMMPSILLALLTTSLHWLSHFKYSLISTPKSFARNTFKINPIHFVVDTWIIVPKVHYFAFFNIEKHLPFFRPLVAHLCKWLYAGQ